MRRLSLPIRTREILFINSLPSWSLISAHGENDQSAEAGTFSDATVNVELPVSAISRLLIRLEKHLDLLLVCRGQHGLALTDAGRNISYPVKEPCGSCARDASFSINIVPVHPGPGAKGRHRSFLQGSRSQRLVAPRGIVIVRSAQRDCPWPCFRGLPVRGWVAEPSPTGEQEHRRKLSQRRLLRCKLRTRSRRTLDLEGKKPKG